MFGSMYTKLEDPNMSDAINSNHSQCHWRDEFRLRESLLIERWKVSGLFTDEDLDLIDCYWFQFNRAPMSNHLILALVFFAVSLIGCLSNALVFYILVTSRHLRTPANILIINLAASDFLMLIKMPIFIYNSLLQGPALGYRGCEVYGFLSGVTGCCSIMSLVAVAVERCCVIRRPLDEKNRQPSRRRWAFLGVVYIWIYSTVIAALPLFGFGQYVPEGYLTSCSFDYLSDKWTSRAFVLTVFVAFWVTPLSIIIISYGAIVRQVKQAKMEIHASRCDQPNERSDQALQKNRWVQFLKIELPTAKISLGLVSVWIVSWTPYAIVALMGVTGNQNRLTPGMTMLPALFAKTSACLNPFIYSLSHPKIKKEIARRYQYLTSSHGNISVVSVRPRQPTSTSIGSANC